MGYLACPDLNKIRIMGRQVVLWRISWLMKT